MMTTMLTESAKFGAKIGSKFFFTVAGGLTGYAISQGVLPAMRKSMDKYMSSEEWNKLTPEQQATEINIYNLEATAVNGLCSAAGAVLGAIADNSICNVIDKSGFKTSSNNSFTINNFTI